jgi:hypothetical protein
VIGVSSSRKRVGARRAMETDRPEYMERLEVEGSL